MRTLGLFDLAFLASAAGAADVDILDTFEDYTVGQNLNTLNGGTGWNGAWVGRMGSNGLIAEDTFESYSLGGLDGENGGSGWNGAWVSR